jgi:hypothetical protein
MKGSGSRNVSKGLSIGLSFSKSSIFPKMIELLSSNLEMLFVGCNAVAQDKGKIAAIKTVNLKM